MPTPLSTAQYALLEHAIDHEGGRIIDFPDSLRGGARHKVIQGLFSKALILRDGNNEPWRVSAEGYRALGREMPVLETQPPTAEDQPHRRQQSKQDTVMGLLRRPEGATIEQICEATGWLRHSARGLLAGPIKKRLGLLLASEKSEGGQRIYRLA